MNIRLLPFFLGDSSGPWGRVSQLTSIYCTPTVCQAGSSCRVITAPWRKLQIPNDIVINSFHCHLLSPHIKVLLVLITQYVILAVSFAFLYVFTDNTSLDIIAGNRLIKFSLFWLPIICRPISSFYQGYAQHFPVGPCTKYLTIHWHVLSVTQHSSRNNVLMPGPAN